MSEKRYLIVNADDFGLSHGVNTGIIRAHEEGVVTSASMMVRANGAAEAARFAGSHPGLSLGIHIDLGEWDCTDGTWKPVYRVVDLGDISEVHEEVYEQLSAFRQLVGREPTHIDSHQHVHLRASLREIFVSVADGLDIPLRCASGQIHYFGNFYGQDQEGQPLPGAIAVEGLIRTLGSIRPGITELSCHPAKLVDFHTMYGNERVRELRTLCDPRVRDAIGALHIELCSFDTVNRQSAGERK